VSSILSRVSLSQPPAVVRDDVSRNDRAIAVWLVACAAMIAVMVVLGGITRLTESGLSITEWRPIAGALPPLGEAAWQGEFAKYQEIPQFRLLHAWMTLADFKTIYFWEWLHRLWGRLIGVAFAVPFAWFLLRRQIERSLMPRLAGLFILGGLQGALGWFMVQSGLTERVEVSQYRLVAHLGLAVLIYAAILRVALDLLWPPPARSPSRAAGLRRAAGALSGLVFVTMLAGGFVAGLNAGLTYNTFPLMDGRLVPAGYLQLSPWWLNAFENVAAVQFDHRLLATATLVAVLALWGASRIIAMPLRARRTLDTLLAAGLLQVALGIATLLLVVPIPLAVAHQAGALALFTAALVAHHALRAAATLVPTLVRQLDESRPALL
jgi:cytochrome c oxidase assembly protein subunit 15